MLKKPDYTCQQFFSKQHYFVAIPDHFTNIVAIEKN